MTSEPPHHAPVQPTWHHRILIPLAALLVVHPLIVHGCSCGHDFDFHLLNWMEAARQFSHGNLHPHWAFTPAYNAGEPRFVFYPPFSWMLGALLGLLLTHLPGVSEAAGWTATPILFTWVALTLSGFTFYRLARAFASENAALFAAIIYISNPYMLFTAFERTAYAELLAAAWIPLLLHAILRDKITILRIALPVALLWLTNAPAAVMGSYTLALLATLRIATTYRTTTTSGVAYLASETWVSRHRSTLQLALRTSAGTLLGLALAAFYIIPAAYERRFVQIAMATISGMSIHQNFLFKHTGTSPDDLLHDAVLHTASLIAIILLAATTAALIAVFIRRKQQAEDQTCTFPILPLAILTAGIAFLLTPLSTPIWNHTPQASFLQFPWRLLAILAPIFALTLARAFTKSPSVPSITGSSPWPDRKNLAVGIVVLTALTLPAYHLFHQPCDPEDTAPARLALFHSNIGTDPTDEYTPTTADNDALAPTNPPCWLTDSPMASAPATAQPGPTPAHLTLTAPHAEDLILNLRDYPAWLISLNGTLDPTREPRPDGLIAIPIAAGKSTIGIHYAHTTDQTIGDTITLIALILFLFALRTEPRKQAAL